jgi:GT2 family glycosyltransferase
VRSMSVAVINYNTREHLRRCLSSIRAEAPADIVVVDNASSDGSAEMVRACFPEVRLHAASVNHGYGAGCNRALEHSRAEFVLLLNSDTLLQPGCVDALSRYLEAHPSVGLAGPRLINPDGSLQRSCHRFPTPGITLLEMTPLRRVVRHLPWVRERYPRTWSHDRPKQVPWVTGAALAVRREAWAAAGGFDESYFMYQEEVDLSYRMLRAGWQTHFTPTGTVVHIGGASTAQYRSAMAEQHLTSVLRFYDRHHRATRRAAAKAIVKATVLGRWLRDAIRYHTTREPETRHAMTENMAAWKRVLRDEAEPRGTP